VCNGLLEPHSGDAGVEGNVTLGTVFPSYSTALTKKSMVLKLLSHRVLNWLSIYKRYTVIGT